MQKNFPPLSPRPPPPTSQILLEGRKKRAEQREPLAWLLWLWAHKAAPNRLSTSPTRIFVSSSCHSLCNLNLKRANLHETVIKMVRVSALGLSTAMTGSSSPEGAPEMGSQQRLGLPLEGISIWSIRHRQTAETGTSSGVQTPRPANASLARILLQSLNSTCF